MRPIRSHYRLTPSTLSSKAPSEAAKDPVELSIRTNYSGVSVSNNASRNIYFLSIYVYLQKACRHQMSQLRTVCTQEPHSPFTLAHPLCLHVVRGLRCGEHSASTEQARMSLNHHRFVDDVKWKSKHIIMPASRRPSKHFSQQFCFHINYNLGYFFFSGLCYHQHQTVPSCCLRTQGHHL